MKTLVVDNISVSYGSVIAVRNVSFDVGEGELVGLIGANGAGKSTTLKAIAGVIAASSGEITFCEQPVRGQSPEALARRGLALLPEGRQIFTRLSVGENLRLAAGTRGNRDPRAQDEVLERFPALRDRLKTPAGQLSGGQQGMLALARGLLAKPKLLMLDEPSLGLAPQLVDQMFDTFAELQSDGVTILLVEQNAIKTLAIADRTWVLRNGVSQSVRADDPQVSQTVLRGYLGEEKGGRMR